jgi:large subunit ribosomal protein L6
MPIPVPQGVKVSIKKDGVTVTGPKGELSRCFNPDMGITQDNDNLIVSRPSDSKVHRSLHGLTRSLLANMVQGVSSGYSHPVEVSPLPGVSLEVEGSNIKVSGIDKEAVGEMAAEIRAIRPPDVYKGKGIRYAGELVRLKAGKAGKAIGKRK